MKIHTFIRFCTKENNRERPKWFNKESCYNNFVKTNNVLNNIETTYIVDGDPGAVNYLKINSSQNINVIKNPKGGTDPLSFEGTLDYVLVKIDSFDKNDIIYFLEDDYLHNHNWSTVLIEGISLVPEGYVTLYDHGDKYPPYSNKKSNIVPTKSAHWRNVASTTNTYAMTVKTLLEDISYHQSFLTRDHDKFLALKHRTVISCIPGYSTHVQPPFMSPAVNWESLS